MNKLEKKKRSLLIISLLFSFALPLGLFLLIFGLNIGWLFLWIPGIVFLVAGFYGTPLLWVGYASYFPQIRIANCILNGILSFEQMSKNTGLKLKEVINIVQKLINDYLPYYLINENKTGLLINLQRQQDVAKGRCRYCGAYLLDNSTHCTNCGAPV
ncbi:MAG: zinc ribbon domain-containing protein [Bacillales bacterium]|jgi:hypothetical protein|nr:zinc ribbon domain-containing protein [Bacillales bacterium]